MRRAGSSSSSSVTKPQSPRLLCHRLQTASRMADSGVQAGTCFMKNKQPQPRASVSVEVEGLSLRYRISAKLCLRERSPGFRGAHATVRMRDEVMLSTWSQVPAALLQGCPVQPESQCSWRKGVLRPPTFRKSWASQVVLVIKNLPANAADSRDLGLIPGLRRSPGEGNGHLLQYSCLENPMDRGAWWATVPGVAKRGT